MTGKKGKNEKNGSKFEVPAEFAGMSIDDLYRRRQSIYDNEILTINRAIRALEISKMREERTSDSIDGLVCPDHPDSRFVKEDGLKGSYDDSISDFRSYTYVCDCCLELPYLVRKRAYECPECGFVLGEPKRDIREWNDRSEGARERYMCYICSTDIVDGFKN